MHPLNLFRKKNKLTQEDISKSLGIHPTYLSAIERRVRTPSARLCRLIEHITNGEVTFNDLIPPIAPSSASLSEKVSLKEEE